MKPVTIKPVMNSQKPVSAMTVNTQVRTGVNKIRREVQTSAAIYIGDTTEMTINLAPGEVFDLNEVSGVSALSLTTNGPIDFTHKPNNTHEHTFSIEQQFSCDYLLTSIQLANPSTVDSVSVSLVYVPFTGTLPEEQPCGGGSVDPVVAFVDWRFATSQEPQDTIRIRLRIPAGIAPESFRWFDYRNDERADQYTYEHGFDDIVEYTLTLGANDLCLGVSAYSMDRLEILAFAPAALQGNVKVFDTCISARFDFIEVNVLNRVHARTKDACFFMRVTGTTSVGYPYNQVVPLLQTDQSGGASLAFLFAVRSPNILSPGDNVWDTTLEFTLGCVSRHYREGYSASITPSIGNNAPANLGSDTVTLDNTDTVGPAAVITNLNFYSYRVTFNLTDNTHLGGIRRVLSEGTRFEENIVSGDSNYAHSVGLRMDTRVSMKDNQGGQGNVYAAPTQSTQRYLLNEYFYEPNASLVGVAAIVCDPAEFPGEQPQARRLIVTYP